MPDRRPTRRREIVILILSLTVIPLAAAYGILEYQHRRSILTGLETPPDMGSDSPPSPENFAPGRAVPEQPAITKIEIVPAERAGRRVEDDEIVIGVVIDGKARAYPLNMMTEFEREVFNDELGGTPLAATW